MEPLTFKKAIIERFEHSKKAKKRGYESIHQRSVQDERHRNSRKEIERTEELCCALDQLENTDRCYRATREERERYHNLWVFRQTEVSVRTTATAAHTDCLNMFAEFRQTKNAVAAANGAHRTPIPLKHQRQQRQRPQQPQQLQQQSQQWQGLVVL